MQPRQTSSDLKLTVSLREKKQGTHSITPAISPTTDPRMQGSKVVCHLQMVSWDLPALILHSLGSPCLWQQGPQRRSPQGTFPPLPAPSAEGQGERRRDGTGHVELDVPPLLEPGAEEGLLC